MEPRRLLAADGGVAVAAQYISTLVVNGTEGNDTITLERVGIDDVRITVNGASQTYDMDDVGEYSLRGLGGHDTITKIGTVRGAVSPAVSLSGGEGIDTLRGTDALFSGGEVIRDESGRQVGDAGTEGDGTLRILGTDGEDAISLLATDDGPLVQINASFRGLFSTADFNTWGVNGGGGNDTQLVTEGFPGVVFLLGDDGNDRFVVERRTTTHVGGHAGDDSLEVRGGDESNPLNVASYEGGTGTDDIVLGDVGRVDLNEYPDVENVLNAHGEVVGNALNNSILAVFNDPRPLTARGGEGNDILAGGSGNDRLFGEGGDDRLLGRDGDDHLDGGPGTDFLDGGPGDDTLVNGESTPPPPPPPPVPQVFISSDRTLTVIGTPVGDLVRLVRVGVDDVRVEANGEEFVFDMDDFDRVRLEGRDGDDTLRLTAGIARATLLGGNGIDNLVGNELPNTFRGGAGNDVIDGLQGNDSLYGEAGNDLLNGGAGNDLLDGDGGDDLFDGGTGADTMYGDDGNDTFYARDNVKDTISGGPGTADASQHDAIDVRTGVERTIA